MSLLPHSRFSTDDLEVKDRLACWREDISVIFDLEQAPIPDPEPFHAVFDLYHFGHSVLGHLDSSTGRYVRSPRKAARDGMDSILLQLFLEGGVQFGVGQRTTYADAGDIVVFDLSQPVDNINRKFQHLTLMWPRPAIEEVVPDIARWHGHCLPRNNPAVELLRRHMCSSHELAPSFSPQEGLRVEAAALSLAAAGMAGKGMLPDTPPQSTMEEVLIYQIKRHIRKHLGSADLSPDQIANQFGISRRRLYQLLQPIGGIARYQRQLRLQRCFADLQNPAHAHLQISEIAYRWGFNHLGTFNRNFRATFGITPSDARCKELVAAHAQNSASPTGRKEEEMQAEHQQWFIALGI